MTPYAERKYRAFSLMCAAISWKGSPDDAAGMSGLADEYYKYILGDDNATIPRPDKITPGRLPRR